MGIYFGVDFPMNERYIQQGEYYIQDTVTHKKISYREAVDVLNHKEHIIKDKSVLVENLSNTLKAYESNLKTLEEDKKYYKTLLEKLIG